MLLAIFFIFFKSENFLTPTSTEKQGSTFQQEKHIKPALKFKWI